MRRSLKSKYLRNFTFGVEDSLISTVGVLSGVAAAGEDTITIVLTGLILISVEAFSMAIGSLLTEQTTDEFAAHREISLSHEVPAALTMFFSYFISGLLPLSPYLLFPLDLAFFFSIAVSLLALFGLGLFSAKVAKVGLLKSAFQMFFLGGIAVFVGAFIGRLF